MGIFSNKYRKKLSKLRKLQLRISPPNRSSNDFISDIIQSSGSNIDDSEKALEELIDLCVEDEGVKEVMMRENISREDLLGIHVNLSVAGAGQWIKGHHVASSTIAYAETLYYTVKSEEKGTSRMTIVNNLLDYWEGKIPQGKLIDLI